VRLVDANILIYAVNSASAHHPLARKWLDTALAGSESVGLAWAVVLAFLRLSTHPAVFGRALTPAQATEVVRSWLTQPAAVIVEPGPQHLELLAGLLAEAGTAGNLVSDAHLAAIAIQHDAELVSFDRDFARFAGLRWAIPE